LQEVRILVHHSQRLHALHLLLRCLGVLSTSFLLLRASRLLFVGGTVMTRAATPQGMPPAPPVMTREVVIIAIVPLAVALFTCIGLVRGHLPSIWIGGALLVVSGLLLIFSLGFEIAIVGSLILIIAVILTRQARS
jgi:hypothetical protein